MSAKNINLNSKTEKYMPKIKIDIKPVIIKLKTNKCHREYIVTKP